jgi:Lectin C-type domain
MKIAFSFATMAAAAAALAAASTMLLASFSLAAVAAGVTPVLPAPKKVCHMKNVRVKNCVVVHKPPRTKKKPTPAAVKIPAAKKPTQKPSRRPTRFPTGVPTTNRPSTTVPSAGPTSGPSDSPSGSPTSSDSPTARPSTSPTSSPTSGCPTVEATLHFHGGHRYARVSHDEPLTWYEAEVAAGDLTCCGATGHLVTVGDAAERDFVQDTVVVSGFGQYGWVGFTDADTEGTYVWTDGTTLDTTLFAPEPYFGDADADDCGFFFDDPSSSSRWYTLDATTNVVDYSIVEFDCSGLDL